MPVNPPDSPVSESSRFSLTATATDMAPRTLRWLLVVLVLLAAAARMYRLQAQSIWFDEAFMIQAGQAPWPAVLWAEPNHPPLYALVLHLVVRLIGDSAFAMRWPSVMAGLVVTALTARLAGRLFDRRAAFFGGLLAAFSPMLWWASQEARMYIFMAALVAVMAEAWHQLVFRAGPKRRAWLMLWGAELLLLYTQLSSPAAVLWINAVTVLAWSARRSLRRPDWRIWSAGQAAVIALWLPWLLPYILGAKTGGGDPVPAAPAITLQLAGELWQSFWAASSTLVGREPLVTGLSLLILAIAGLIIPWRAPAAPWLAVHVVGLTLSVVAGLVGLQKGYNSRYLVLATPLLIALIAGGLGRLTRRPGRWAAAGLASLPFLAVFAVGVDLVARNPAYAHDDSRAMVQYYADTLGPQDTVVAWSYVERYDLTYYWRRLGVPAALLMVTDNPGLDAFWTRLPRTGNVSLNTWYQERADYRAMAPCVLAHGQSNLPDEYAVPGLRDRLYRGPRQTPIGMRAVEAAFTVARVTAAGSTPAFPADRALCLPVQITLAQWMEVPLKVALIARNDLGAEIARADAVFARDDQHSSALLGPGETLLAFPLLRLPYGAPAGAYPLTLRLYSDDALSGHDVLSVSGAPAGKDLALGVWNAPPGSDWAHSNRVTELPTLSDLKVGGGLRLLAHDLDQTAVIPVINGDRVPLSLLWSGAGPLPALTLAAADNTWHAPVLTRQAQLHDAIILDWRQVQVPPQAGAGPAALTLPDGTVLARFVVEALPFVTVPPAMPARVDAELPGVGTLAGYSLQVGSPAAGQPAQLTLLWRAGETVPETSYVVFAQLLSPEGVVIAQSDAVPAAGARPTFTWRANEYILDPHVLVYNAAARSGAAALIVGLYHPETLQRLKLPSGADAVILATDVAIP